MSKSLDDLTEIVALLNLRAMEQHRKNVAEEEDLRKELGQIDELRSAAQADTQSLGARRLSGADTLWQGWLAGQRSEILQRTALARARRNESEARAQRALAKEDAVNALREAERSNQKKLRNDRMLQALEALSILRQER